MNSLLLEVLKEKQKFLWRFKKDRGVFNEGYVIQLSHSMVHIGVNSNALNGVWARIDEIDIETL